MGAKRGVPDVWILDAPPRFPRAPGCVIELKRADGGRLSPEQREWLSRLASAGWCASVATYDEALAYLEWLGYLGVDDLATGPAATDPEVLP